MLVDQQRDHTSSEDLCHSLQTGERNGDERALGIEASLQHQCVKTRVPSQLVAERLVCDDEAGQQPSAGSLAVELRDHRVDQPRDLGKKPSVVAEVRPQGLRHREYELSVRKIKQDFVGEVLRE